MTLCPICNVPGAKDQPVSSNGHDVNCPGCGRFITNDETLGLIRARNRLHPYVRSLMTHSIRGMQSSGVVPFIDQALVREITKQTPPSLREQSDRLVIFLGDRLRLSDPAEFTRVAPWDFYALLATIGVYSEATFWLIVERLGSSTCSSSGRNLWQFRLTLELWDRYEILRKLESESRLAFMAMAFNKSEIEQMYESWFKPASSATGFELRTLREGQHAGIIDDQLRVENFGGRVL